MIGKKNGQLVQRVKPAPDHLLAENAALLQAVENAAGFVPNGFYAVGWKPKVLEAMIQLALAVLNEEGRIGKELKWLVGNMASRAVGCRYCWAHTASNALNLGGASKEKVEAVWEFQTNPLFSDKERAAMNFAVAAASVPNGVNNENFGELRKYFDDEEIVEIMSVVSIFGWYNRWNDSMATLLEEEPLSFAQESLKTGGWNEGKTTGNWK